MEKKFQWSAMYGGKQYVIRTDDKKEFDLLVNEYETIVDGKGKDKPKDPTDSWKQEANKENDAKGIEGALGFCKDCGGAKIMGKNGKPYCKPCYIKWAEANKNR